MYDERMVAHINYWEEKEYGTRHKDICELCRTQ